MRGKAEGKNVGHIPCPLCEATAAVRRTNNARGLLYIYCVDCGVLNAKLAQGQAIIEDKAVFWENGPPPDMPRWIREGRNYKPRTPEPDNTAEDGGSKESERLTERGAKEGAQAGDDFGEVEVVKITRRGPPQAESPEPAPEPQPSVSPEPEPDDDSPTII